MICPVCTADASVVIEAEIRKAERALRNIHRRAVAPNLLP